MDLELEQIDCPVCGPTQTRIWLDDGKPTRYVRCRVCKTVYSSPRYTQKIRHTQTKESWAYTDGVIRMEAMRRPALQREAELIQQHGRQGRMLDVGCSAGDFFEFFPADQWERYGVELSDSMSAYAAERYSAKVLAGTLRDAQFSSSSFDLVSMIDMFYYVDDPLAELAEVKRILKPKGILAIEITGQSYMFFRSRGLIALLMEGRWCRLSSDSHLYWFKPSGLQQLLKNNGFHPITWYVVPSPTRPNRFANSISSAYYRVFSAVAGHSMRALNWSPKYLCLAQIV